MKNSLYSTIRLLSLGFICCGWGQLPAYEYDAEIGEVYYPAFTAHLAEQGSELPGYVQHE